MSTGMSNLGEVEAAINVLEKAGTPSHLITVLHCNSEYPTPMRDVNLRAMVSMGNVFGLKFGYSDHTQGIEVPIAAVAMGASVIEKHITLDRNMTGPDHFSSLEPKDFLSMVQSIRNIEKALGSCQKKISSSEDKNISVIRKSIVAKCRINMGDTYSTHNLCTKRPGTGLSPMLWDEIIGRRANKNYEINDFIEL